jgi:hypothetical protein
MGSAGVFAARRLFTAILAKPWTKVLRHTVTAAASDGGRIVT